MVTKEDIGLYRDDGLMVLRNSTKRRADILRKDIIKVFKNIGFDIDIVNNMKAVDFLDVTFDLPSGTYRPYKKPNDQLQYIHTSSNHPANILKQLPISINKRLKNNSSNEAIFNNAKPGYEKALEHSGYKDPKLSFKDDNQRKTSHRNRKRNVTWFNPPFSKSVATNIAKSFLRLVDKHFTKTNKLRKIFNRSKLFSSLAISCLYHVTV